MGVLDAGGEVRVGTLSDGAVVGLEAATLLADGSMIVWRHPPSIQRLRLGSPPSTGQSTKAAWARALGLQAVEP